MHKDQSHHTIPARFTPTWYLQQPLLHVLIAAIASSSLAAAHSPPARITWADLFSLHSINLGATCIRSIQTIDVSSHSTSEITGGISSHAGVCVHGLPPPIAIAKPLFQVHTSKPVGLEQDADGHLEEPSIRKRRAVNSAIHGRDNYVVLVPTCTSRLIDAFSKSCIGKEGIVVDPTGTDNTWRIATPRPILRKVEEETERQMTGTLG